MITLGKPLLGISTLIRIMYGGGDITPIWNDLLIRAKLDIADTAAQIELSVILQATGQRDTGLSIQATAIQMQRLYHRIHGDGTGLRVLNIATAGDMTANTPTEFLLEGSNSLLYYLYVDADMTAWPELPDCDVAFMAVGESPDNQAVLANLDRLLPHWPGPPILNAKPGLLASMTRDGTHAALKSVPSIVSPPIHQVQRADLMEMATGGVAVRHTTPPLAFPMILRPVGTHAGTGMAKVETATALAGYLEDNADATFYASEFIDYSGADGLFRKVRVAMIRGRPYPAHMAVSSDWMVHYLNADMHLSAEKRHEEMVLMRDFHHGFAARHAVSLAAIQAAFPLDYFGIDCAEMPDGRLLVFELDNIMIVHDMDPEDIYSYKKPEMTKLFAAFQAELLAASRAT